MNYEYSQGFYGTLTNYSAYNTIHPQVHNAPRREDDMDKLKKKNRLGAPNSTEWSRTGSFMNKPEVGWIHPDTQLGPEAGICYGVRVGSLFIKLHIAHYI